MEKGGLFFNNFIDVVVEVDKDAPVGERISKVVNTYDGQVVGQVSSGKNAIIKQTTQTIDEDFKIGFEVELTDEELQFAQATTARGMIFLCRDNQNRPMVLTPGRKQTSYMYYISTAGAGFLAVYTNNAGVDNLARIFANDEHQKVESAIEGNKIVITVENISRETIGNRLGYLKLPEGYHWDVKVIAF